MLKGIKHDLVSLFLETLSREERHLDGSSSGTTLGMENSDVHTRLLNTKNTKT